MGSGLFIKQQKFTFVLERLVYKHEFDAEGIPQFGLVAEQVQKVNPDLVVRDADGKVNTVRYEAVNAMLLKEFLKEHQKVEKLECTVAMQEKDFKATIAQQQKQIEALTGDCPESERASRRQQTCTTVSRQSLKAAGVA
jgi:hypothetical protein